MLTSRRSREGQISRPFEAASTSASASLLLLETVSLGLSSVVLLSSAWFFFRQRELSNVTFVRWERAAAASRLAANQAAGTQTSSLTTEKRARNGILILA